MQAGDAIFIPEGWWHQIDSAAGTIAVNIWWRSTFCRLLGSHMDSYYLRRALQSLTDAQKARLLTRPQAMAAPAEPRHDSANFGGEAGLGSMQEHRCTEQQRCERDRRRSQQGETQPVRGGVPAQHASSADWAGTAGNSGLDEHRSAKRQRSEACCDGVETGTASVTLLP